MKMKALFGGFCVFMVIVSASMVSCKGKAPEEKIPVEKKMTLTIVNNTKAVIEKVVFQPSGGEPFTQSCSIQKGGSYTADLKKYDSYSIVLVDTKGHQYGKEGCRWVDGSAELSITDKDFVSQGLWDTLKKTLGL
jgi:hypothetical protein